MTQNIDKSHWHDHKQFLNYKEVLELHDEFDSEETGDLSFRDWLAEKKIFEDLPDSCIWYRVVKIDPNGTLIQSGRKTEEE